MRLRWPRRHAPAPGAAPASAEAPPATGPAAGPAPPPAAERLTAVEWARRHQVNAVMAERAAMYAGKWHEPVTEEEFLEMIRRADV
ncbi:MAG TPA: hypothetical protein VGB42_12590 [Candidatus Thermoplasmatota archaeon]